MRYMYMYICMAISARLYKFTSGDFKMHQNVNVKNTFCQSYINLVMFCSFIAGYVASTSR